MPLYTFDAGDTPVLIVSAADLATAQAICDEAADELQDLGAFGASGDVTIRDADQEERMHWEAAIADAVELGEVDSREQAEEENHMVLLVPLAQGGNEDDLED